VEQFELYGGEPAEASLPSASVIGLLDPGDHRQAEFLSGVPALPVQDVLLQQGEEGLHGGVVTARADPAHRADEPVVGQGADEGPGTKLTAPVRMNDRAGR